MDESYLVCANGCLVACFAEKGRLVCWASSVDVSGAYLLSRDRHGFKYRRNITFATSNNNVEEYMLQDSFPGQRSPMKSPERRHGNT